MFTVASVTFDGSFYNSSESDGVLSITLISSLAAEFSFVVNVITTSKRSIIYYYALFIFLFKG